MSVTAGRIRPSPEQLDPTDELHESAGEVFDPPHAGNQLFPRLAELQQPRGRKEKGEKYLSDP